MSRFFWKLFLACCLLFYFANSQADETEFDIAQAVENPLKVNRYTKHISLPFENDTNFAYGADNNYQNILKFTPVLPFRFTRNYDLVLRTIAPIFERTPTENASGVFDGNCINGWGDLNPTFFITPSRYQYFMWGFGPSLFIPTATNSRNIGSGKWSAGPSLALVVMPEKRVLGFVGYNVWSFADEASRSNANQFSFQYFIYRNYDKGWFLTSSPTIMANWQASSN